MTQPDPQFPNTHRKCTDDFAWRGQCSGSSCWEFCTAALRSIMAGGNKHIRNITATMTTLTPVALTQQLCFFVSVKDPWNSKWSINNPSSECWKIFLCPGMTELLYLEAILSASHESYSYFFLSLTHEQSNGLPTANGSFYVKTLIAFYWRLLHWQYLSANISITTEINSAPRVKRWTVITVNSLALLLLYFPLLILPGTTFPSFIFCWMRMSLHLKCTFICH